MSELRNEGHTEDHVDQAAKMINRSLARVARPVIEIVNRVPRLAADQDVDDFARAMQRVLDGPFRAAWNRTARMVITPADADPDPTSWVLELRDQADEPGALGYHETKAGLPLMRAFLGTDRQYGYDWRVTASHEVEEALADPELVWAGIDDKGRAWALEVGDPVEADELAMPVPIGGGQVVPISDFVTPAWFLDDGEAPFDFAGSVGVPFQVLAGGYAQWTSDLQHWHQVGTEQHRGIVDARDLADAGESRDRGDAHPARNRDRRGA
jgi:hypothetical protein